MHITSKTNAFLTKSMKITSLNLIAGILLSGISYANAGYAQGILNKKISLQADDMSLKLVLNQIRNKAAVKFVYSSRPRPRR